MLTFVRSKRGQNTLMPIHLFYRNTSPCRLLATGVINHVHSHDELAGCLGSVMFSHQDLIHAAYEHPTYADHRAMYRYARGLQR